MKFKALFIGIALLAGLAVVGNKFYGNKIAGELDTVLRQRIAEIQEPITITYDDIAVNPLFSTVTFTDVDIAIEKEDFRFKSEVIDVHIPYSEAMHLAESKKFEKINTLAISMQKPKAGSKEEEALLSSDEVYIAFDGHLTQEDIENLNQHFPALTQKLEVSVENFDVNAQMLQNKQTAMLASSKQFQHIDNAHMKFTFMPEKGQIAIDDVSIASPVFNSKSNVLVHYKGDGMKSFVAEKMDVNGDMRLTPQPFELENGTKLELERLVMKSNSTMALNNGRQSIINGSFSLVMDELHTSSSAASGSSLLKAPFMPVGIDSLDVETLEVNYTISDKKLVVKDTKLKSSLLDITVEADVDMDADNRNASKINKARLEATNLSDELQKTVTQFEQQMGKALPREDNKIILEATGTLGSPKIKGLF